MIQNRQNLEFFLSFFPDLFPSIDELDGHLISGQDFLASPDDRESSSAEFFQFDVAAFEVALPTRVQVWRRILKK